MDTLSKAVSDLSLGPKWHQLYNRLGLEPRKRFSITVEHKDKTGDEKVRCCVLDTIALWRRTEAVQKMKEREMMKQLLVALQKVQGFETIALQLSESHGNNSRITIKGCLGTLSLIAKHGVSLSGNKKLLSAKNMHGY